MSPTARAFYGALAGAMIVLLAHPLSRPFVLQGFGFVGRSKFLEGATMLPDNIVTLPQPGSLEQAALWVETACQLELASQKLGRDDALLLVEIVQTAAAQDPDNAFWRQAEAIYLGRLGNRAASLKAWRTASVASRWDDYQVLRLESVLGGLARESGVDLGWHYALVESRKSSAVPQAVLAYARKTMRGHSGSDFDLRLATLRNGRLLRDGSRSVESASMGIELIELAAYSSVGELRGYRGTSGPLTPRVVSRARDELLRTARSENPAVAAEIGHAFREDDAREAFISASETDEQKLIFTVASVLSATLPGALVTTGVIGALICLFGCLLNASRAMQIAFTPPWTQLLGIECGVAVFTFSRLFFPSLWAAVSLCSFGVRHDHERQATPGGLGSAYGLTIVTLAIGFSLLMAFHFVLLSSPGQYLLDDAGISVTLVSGSSALVSLSSVVVGLALVTASVWGFLARIPAERLAGASLARFGSVVCLGCFAVAVFLVPISIGVDRSVGGTLAKIFQNEPTYYLTR